MSRQRLQRGLVVAQIAVSVVLLAGAGLLTRTMVQLSEVSTGLKTEQVLTIPVQLLSLGDGDFARIAQSDAAAKEGYDRMLREIRALPGVVEVGRRLDDAAARLRRPVRGQGRRESARRRRGGAARRSFEPPTRILPRRGNSAAQRTRVRRNRSARRGRRS